MFNKSLKMKPIQEGKKVRISVRASEDLVLSVDMSIQEFETALAEFRAAQKETE